MNMMSTPTIWIFFPLLLSLVLSAVHRLHKLSVWIVCLGSLLLSVAAFILPQNLDFTLGGRNFLFDDTFLILNRALILTGSQLTLDYTPEDVTVNLRGAAQVVCSDLTGVWIYCNWKLIQGNRAHKARAQHPDAFIPVGGMPLYFAPEWARGGEIAETPHPRGRTPEPLKKILAMTPDEARRSGKGIRWLFVSPGSAPPPAGDEKILALLGFGAGNAPTVLLEEVAAAYPEGAKPLVIACSQAEGDVKDPGAYHDVGMAYLSQRGFEVWGQMDYPVEFIHALGCFALMAYPSDPGRVLGKFLRKY